MVAYALELEIDHIRLVGEVNDEANSDLLKNAAIDWPEPFGSS